MVKFFHGIMIEHVVDEVFSLVDDKGECITASERELVEVFCGELGMHPMEFFRVITEATGNYPTIEDHEAEFGKGSFLQDFGAEAYRKALLREPFDSAA